MKKIVLSLTMLFMFTLSATAQYDTIRTRYMNVRQADGTRVRFNINDIDSVFFSTEEVLQKIYGVADITPDIYKRQPTEDGVETASEVLRPYLQQALAGQYIIRGGKEGGLPAAHAYQQQYSLGPDLYAQYFTIPHKNFMYGTHTSTYDLSAEFNGNALGAYAMAKEAFIPLLHHPMVDSIPEIKAINLLYYSLIAQENADLSGPYTYLEDKSNHYSPKTYNDLRTIYHDIVATLDDIVDCLKYYETRPYWYKDKITDLLLEYHQTYPGVYISGDTSMNSYIKLANSLKLRMAMHIVKVEPETAQRWAEEAVAGGVVENADEQQGLFPMISGFNHPLPGIANSWGDLRMSASFESLLMSLDHPYTKYLFMPNSYDIHHKNGVDVLPAGTRICGIRSGTMVGNGQTYALNKRLAYSTFSTDVVYGSYCPLYFVKWAEVDFLRAEGALRGWNMGGTAQFFYERGIRNAYLEDPLVVAGSLYPQLVDAYMAQEVPVEYIQVDPMGDGQDWPSTTTIGVKWNEADDNETKLEKIITQKYIALFPLSTEAWTELRRTGYPKLFPVLNTNDGDGSIKQGDMIRRIPWAPTDPTVRENINSTGIPALGGPDKQATRLWWDVDKGNF